MRRDELRRLFQADDLCVSRAQLALLQAYANLYEKHGLIADGIAAPLWRCCPNRRDCWRSARFSRPKAPLGGISLPWVGPRYETGGIAVLGMNFNDASGLTMATQLARYETGALEAGTVKMTYDHPGYRGSNFAYCSTRSAALVLDLLAGGPITDRRMPGDLVGPLGQIVRLQTVKCSPVNTRRSNPTDEMWELCPPLLLRDEIAVAQPRYIIGFGGDVRWALQQLSEFHEGPTEGRLHTGTFTSGHDAHVLLIDHPGALKYWPQSHADLRRHLNRIR